MPAGKLCSEVIVETGPKSGRGESGMDLLSIKGLSLWKQQHQSHRRAKNLERLRLNNALGSIKRFLRQFVELLHQSLHLVATRGLYVDPGLHRIGK